MRIRSILYGLTAALVMAACSMAPASASVPIDPGITVSVTAGKDYPAAMAIVVDEAVIQVAEAAAIEGDGSMRSSLAASVMTLTSISRANTSLTGFSPPDGRIRC
ncbi:hypothetical protein LZK73_18490 [Neorhizobium galegae]|nr:hypothetical protein LZK73_18490 [Neorhizobium galegae]